MWTNQSVNVSIIKKEIANICGKLWIVDIAYGTSFYGITHNH